jgi:uncharacterized protein
MTPMFPLRSMKLKQCLLLAPILALLVLPLFAGESATANEVRKRMASNLPALDELRKAGKVGENNRGYLEARVQLPDTEKKLLETENRDRRTVYQILAERAQATVESVEKARAEQIRDRSRPGVWLQNPAGEWYQKK